MSAPPARPVTLHEVCRLLGAPRDGVPDMPVTGTAHDSRRVRPGELYVAITGANDDGARFAGDAMSAGAVAVVAHRPVVGIPTIVVPDVRAAAGPVADLVHHHPSRAMAVVGVTGTNGKTSTVHLLAGALGRSGRVGVVSGVRAWGPGFSRPATLTTPEADELQATLAEIRAAGAARAVVEVSSHAVLARRTEGVTWRVAAFTNLSRDHLDAHGDMESYFETKAAFVESEQTQAAVVSVDDDYGRRLAARRPQAWTTSSGGAQAHVAAEAIRPDLTGTAFRLHHPGGREDVRLALLGTHQVDNALVALACSLELGVDVAAAVAGVEAVSRVDGRLVAVREGQAFAAFVDYMHNPAGQRRTLAFLTEQTPGRLVVVVGATGGRDSGKRDLLGAEAARCADVVVVTDESPHDDDPAVLRDAVAAGARDVGRARVVVVPGRRAAFETATALAAPGDTVVVAGRGHDPYLTAGGVRTPFVDEEELRLCCRRLAPAITGGS